MWPIASFCCEAQVGRYQCIADVLASLSPATATTDSLAPDTLAKCRGTVPALTYTGRGTRNLEGGAHQRHRHSCRQAVVPMSQLLCSEVAFTVLLGGKPES
jgi:hypothetical protein